MSLIFLGAGGMMAAAQAMRSIQRSTQRFMSRREMRRAGRLTGRDHGETFGHADLTCFRLCDDCGYLGEPHKEGACPACDSPKMSDIGNEYFMELIRQEEESARLEAPPATQLVGFVLGVGVAVLVWGLTVGIEGLAAMLLPDTSDRNMYERGMLDNLVNLLRFLLKLVLFFAIPFSAVFTFLKAPRRLSWLWFKYSPSPPKRWRGPLYRGDTEPTPQRNLSGVAQAADAEASLSSPLTGRPCLGYHIGVLFDVHGDARPPEWVLQEVEAVDLSVSGEVIPGAQSLIHAKPEPVGPEVIEQRRAEIENFLRRRGLYLTEGEYTFFEAIIAPGDAVDVQLFDPPEAPAHVVPHKAHTRGAPR